MEESLRLERPFPTAAVFMTLLALVLIGSFPFFPEPHALIAAILPLLLSFWLWITRPSEKTLIFSPDHLRDELDDFHLRYEDIAGVTLAGKTPSIESPTIRGGELAVVDRAGTSFQFPGLSQKCARSAYQKLLERVSETGSRDLPSQLSQRLQNDLSMFDEDLVYTYRARTSPGSVSSRLRSVCAILFVSGIAWIGIGASSDRYVFWLVIGIITTVIAVVLFLCSFIQPDAQVRGVADWESSGLAISPRGIAMKQGKLLGELKWSEIKAVHCGHVAGYHFETVQLSRTITLKIDGGQILIHDFYDRPLAIIHRVIQRFWEHG